jgi:hypothetical protein
MKHQENLGEIYFNSTTWPLYKDETFESPLKEGEKIQAFKGLNSEVIIRFYRDKNYR